MFSIHSLRHAASLVCILTGLAWIALGATNLVAAGGDHAGPLDALVIGSLFGIPGLALLVAGAWIGRRRESRIPHPIR